MSTPRQSRHEEPFSQIRAATHLYGLTVRRLLFTRQSLVCAILLGLSLLTVWAWQRREAGSPERFLGEIVVPLFLSFLLPVYCLSFGTATIAGDREEQTLVYLLVSPLRRPWLLLAKMLAAWTLAEAWTLGGLYALCQMAGTAGQATWPMLLPATLAATAAYVALFSMIGVMVRRATVVGLAYALFLEILIGNLPGIAKRLAVSYYARTMILATAAGQQWEVPGPTGEPISDALSGAAAERVLWGIALAFSGLALVIFARREYAR